MLRNLVRRIWALPAPVVCAWIPPMLFWIHVCRAEPWNAGTLLLFGVFCVSPFPEACSEHNKRGFLLGAIDRHHMILKGVKPCKHN